jgi:hypothetical protein
MYTISMASIGVGVFIVISILFIAWILRIDREMNIKNKLPKTEQKMIF